MVRERRQRKETVNRVPIGVWVFAFLFAAGIGYLLGTFHGPLTSSLSNAFGLRGAGSLDLSSVQQTYQILKDNYDGTLDDAKLIEGASKGLVEAVGDEYTVYMNADESTQFDNDLTGNIGGGVGIEVSERNDKLTIIRILKDNPAEKAGLQAGDVLVSINSETVDGLTVEEAVAKIRGEVGTTVKLTVLRSGATHDFTVTRAEINNPSVYSSVENGIGIMTVTRFDDQTGALAKAVAQTFKSQGVRAVILDLRGNGGGYVTAAQDLAGLWLEDKVIVTERKGSTVVDELRSGKNPILKDIPTVVLVNVSSASASEIVAGALQDHKAATLIGNRTFGKGSVQKLIELPEGAELKVTVARWYTPSGKNISKQGITPDTNVDLTLDDLNANRDPQLDAAKTALK